jgi:hypothetical protein
MYSSISKTHLCNIAYKSIWRLIECLLSNSPTLTVLFGGRSTRFTGLIIISPFVTRHHRGRHDEGYT